MSHPHPDELLLFAGGELPELRVVEVAAHVAECARCRAALDQLDAALTALDTARPPRAWTRARPAVWAGVALATAAALAVVFVRPPQPSPPAADGWVPTTTWSATAGYVAGGRALVDIDAQLTRLEQESYYGRP